MVRERERGEPDQATADRGARAIVVIAHLLSLCPGRRRLERNPESGRDSGMARRVPSMATIRWQAEEAGSTRGTHRSDGRLKALRRVGSEKRPDRARDAVVVVDDRHPPPLVERRARMRNAAADEIADAHIGTDRNPQVRMLVVELVDAPGRRRAACERRPGRARTASAGRDRTTHRACRTRGSPGRAPAATGPRVQISSAGWSPPRSRHAAPLRASTSRRKRS